VASSYFAEGYPYTIVNNLAELVFASFGASLGAVGLTSLFHLPWNLKFLWAPFLDQYETKRRWLIAIEVLLTGALVALALSAVGPRALFVVAAIFLVLGIASATHDIAIDGFYLEALEEADRSRFVGLRQLFYKLANLLVRGPAVVLAGVVGWRFGFAAMAALMAAIAMFHAWALPHVEVPRKETGGVIRGYVSSFGSFLAQPRSLVILAFVTTFRTGESFLQKMKWPFLRDALHLSLEQYGVANGTFGVAASFAGTIAGGWLIARYGLRRFVWPFVLAQNGLHLLYVLLAKAALAGPVGLVTITTVICIEHAGEGLGTAVFTVFLMRCCDPRHKAAHFAIVTAIMSVGFTLAGMASGFLAQWLGFVRYFAFTFVVTIPSMALIVFLPYLDGRPAPAD
jgi:MFS transporter, PAT family, beta-lactamase induction signal transducer AmpG